MSAEFVERLRRPAVDPADEKRVRHLVYACALGVVRSDKYPNPWRTGWTDQDADDLTQNLFATDRHHKLILRAKDDQHLERSFKTTLERMIVDELRKAGMSAVRDRLVDVLRKAGFQQSNDTWGLPDRDPGLVHQGDVAALKHAAERVDVEVLHVRDDSKRSSSFASREDLVALCTGVLTEACAYLPLATLVEVVEHRLGVVASSRYEPIDDNTAERDPVPDADVADTVDGIWDRLEPDQRKLLPYLDPDDSVRAVADEVGFGRDKVSRLRREIHDVLREFLEGHAHAERCAVITLLQRRELDVRRTESGDAAL